MRYEWDEEKKCVVSAADRTVDDLLDCFDLDEEFEFPETDTKRFELDMSAVKDQDKSAAKEGGSSGVNPYDSDSVSTMVSRHDKVKVAQKKSSGKTKEAKNKNQEQEKAKNNLNSNEEETLAENVLQAEADKAAVAAAITGEIEKLKKKLARVMNVPFSSP